MLRLIKIELQKIWFNKSSRNLVFVSLILPFTFILFASIKIKINASYNLKSNDLGIFSFPIIWHFTTYLTSIIKFLFAFVIVGVISNEYSNKTLKQNLIDGLSKQEYICSKFYVIVLYALLATFIITCITFGIGFFMSDTSLKISEIFNGTEYLIAYFLKLVSFFSLCLFLGLAIKRSAFALALIFIIYIAEWLLYGIAYYFLGTNKATSIKDFFPLQAISNLIEQPFQRITTNKITQLKGFTYDYSLHNYEVIIVILWTLIFLTLSYKLLKKRDL